MIAPQELRIGNIMMVGTLLTQVTTINIENFIVTELDTSEGEFNYKSDQCSINNIDLTEEWLIKLGFEKIGTDYSNERYSVYRPVEYVDWIFCEGRLILREIKYIHQLQNLYFALTGEELTIKES